MTARNPIDGSLFYLAPDDLKKEEEDVAQGLNESPG